MTPRVDHAGVSGDTTRREPHAFHDVFPRVAARYGVPLVPFLLQGIALDPAFNGPDLIHPNAAGAQRIAQNVWTYLRPMLTP